MKQVPHLGGLVSGHGLCVACAHWGGTGGREDNGGLETGGPAPCSEFWGTPGLGDSTVCRLGVDWTFLGSFVLEFISLRKSSGTHAPLFRGSGKKWGGFGAADPTFWWHARWWYSAIACVLLSWDPVPHPGVESKYPSCAAWCPLARHQQPWWSGNLESAIWPQLLA